jgi:hypothetical protein
MANVDAPFGLRPIRHLGGAPYNGAANPYHVASTYATALFVGDPVVKVAGGSNAAAVEGPGIGSFAIGTLPTVEKSTAGDGNLITGVIVAVGADPTNLENKHSPASTEDIIWVCDDPHVIFEIQADGAISATTIGLNASVVFTHAGSTVTGLSGVELDQSTAAADASLELLILRAVNREDNDTTLTHCNVEVLINMHSLMPTSAGTDGALGV